MGNYLRLINNEINFDHLGATIDPADIEAWERSMAEADLRTSQALDEVREEIKELQAGESQ